MLPGTNTLKWWICIWNILCYIDILCYGSCFSARLLPISPWHLVSIDNCNCQWSVPGHCPQWLAKQHDGRLMRTR